MRSWPGTWAISPPAQHGDVDDVLLSGSRLTVLASGSKIPTMVLDATSLAVIS